MIGRPTVAITGASGYVGSVLAKALQASANVVELGRVAPPDDRPHIRWSFDSDPSLLARELREKGVTHLVHAAWDMESSSARKLEEVCEKGSFDLLRAASAAGINELVFISTISAFEGTPSSYGRSKHKVEQSFLRERGVVLRLGLVYGENSGGAFGKILKIAQSAPIIPLIGDGNAPQYLLDEASLGLAVQRAVRGDFKAEKEAITIANPEPIRFRDLVRAIALKEGRNPVLLPIPWQLLFFPLRFAEQIGLTLKIKSDSILSFVRQNPSPDFSKMASYSIEVRPFNIN